METLEGACQDSAGARGGRDVWDTPGDGSLAQPVYIKKEASLPTKRSPVIQGRQTILVGDSVLRKNQKKILQGTGRPQVGQDMRCHSPIG